MQEVEEEELLLIDKLNKSKNDKAILGNLIDLVGFHRREKKPDNWRSIHWSKLKKALVHEPIDLLGDTISIRSMTSYKERIY